MGPTAPDAGKKKKFRPPSKPVAGNPPGPPVPTRGQKHLRKEVPVASEDTWGWTTENYWKLGLTKAQGQILLYISHRCGVDSYCFAEIKTIARETRTHPDYCRWVINFLVWKGLITKTRRPGTSSYLDVVPMRQWLASHPAGLRGNIVQPPAYEETKEEATTKTAWEVLWELMPGAPRALYEKRIKTDARRVIRTLVKLQDRLARGQMPGSDGLERVEDPRAMFEYFWRG